MASVDEVRAVQSLSDFVQFSRRLSEEVKRDGSEIANLYTVELLDGLSAWLEENYLSDDGAEPPEHPDWPFVASLFAAGLVYE